MTAEPAAKINFQSRRLAEAVRAFESNDQSRELDDRDAVAEALRAGDDIPLESRVVIRAAALDARELDLADAIDPVRGGLRAAFCAGAVVAFVLGAIAARAALEGETASIFALLVGLLGAQTLLLVVWLIALAASRRGGRAGGGGIAGRAVMAAWQAIAARAHRTDPRRLAAIEAVSATAFSSSIGRWLLSTMTHALWAAANLGMLAALALMFIGEGYRFRWDSTWLDGPTYAALINGVAAAPDALGFPTPSAAEIEQSRTPLTVRDASDAAALAGAAHAWSWFFFGSVIVYGLIPRTILMLVSFGLWGAAERRFRLDMSKPGFARLRRRLMPQPTRIGADAEASPEYAPLHREAPLVSDRPVGPATVIGIEMQRPRSGWPPPLGGSVIDLGIVDGRDAQHAAIDRLIGSRTSASMLLIVCEFRTAPDRGVERFIGELAAAAGGPVTLLLTGGRAFADRDGTETLANRAHDWRNLAARLPLFCEPRVAEIDLDLLTDQSKEALRRLAPGPAQQRAAEPSRIIEAFDALESHASRWPQQVEVKAMVDTQRALAKVYGHERGDWRTILRGALSAEDLRSVIQHPQQAGASIQRAAKSFADMLPGVLRRQPKWMAAGAVAGAVGCIAAAVAIAPVAIAALPSWSLIGAAVAAVAPGIIGSRAQKVHDTSSGLPFADALRACCLFAITLELQGRDESAISRVLERTFDGFEALDDPAPADVPGVLEELQHRYELAIAEERAT